MTTVILLTTSWIQLLVIAYIIGCLKSHLIFCSKNFKINVVGCALFPKIISAYNSSCKTKKFQIKNRFSLDVEKFGQIPPFK